MAISYPEHLWQGGFANASQSSMLFRKYLMSLPFEPGMPTTTQIKLAPRHSETISNSTRWLKAIFVKYDWLKEGELNPFGDKPPLSQKRAESLCWASRAAERQTISNISLVQKFSSVWGETNFSYGVRERGVGLRTGPSGSSGSFSKFCLPPNICSSIVGKCGLIYRHWHVLSDELAAIVFFSFTMHDRSFSLSSLSPTSMDQLCLQYEWRQSQFI